MTYRTSDDRLILIGIAFIGLGISIVANQLGVAQKWDVGLGTTFCIFGVVVKQFPQNFTRPVFWLLVAVLLAFHSFGLWLVLDKILRGTNRIPLMLSGPVAFFEGFILLGILSAVNRSSFHKPSEC
jgi:hypothetical protein